MVCKWVSVSKHVQQNVANKVRDVRDIKCCSTLQVFPLMWMTELYFWNSAMESSSEEQNSSRSVCLFAHRPTCTQHDQLMTLNDSWSHQQTAVTCLAKGNGKISGTNGVRADHMCERVWVPIPWVRPKAGTISTAVFETGSYSLRRAFSRPDRRGVTGSPIKWQEVKSGERKWAVELRLQ